MSKFVTNFQIQQADLKKPLGYCLQSVRWCDDLNSTEAHFKHSLISSQIKVVGLFISNYHIKSYYVNSCNKKHSFDHYESFSADFLGLGCQISIIFYKQTIWSPYWSSYYNAILMVMMIMITITVWWSWHSWPYSFIHSVWITRFESKITVFLNSVWLWNWPNPTRG